ncbi:MAG: TIGR01906 family membrane protein [Firmicutes bacterium HGW-Firmicutes-18]|nr:MAG: TIGR01906 family membrane protein [Firmicutes bacterium HGW-Firmicutes-18]
MKNLTKIILTISLPIFVLLMVFQQAVFDLSYFKNKFVENDTPAVTGLDMEQLMRVSEQTLEYLKDKRDDLIIYEELNGEKIQVFKDREIEHMVDVKDLFVMGYTIRNITGIISLLSIAYLWMKHKKSILQSVRMGSVLFFGLIAIIGSYAVLDFNHAFTIFHELLFTNDLWLLNPETDIMIQMLPLDFFMGIGLKIAVIYMAYLVLSVVSTTILLRKRMSN